MREKAHFLQAAVLLTLLMVMSALSELAERPDVDDGAKATVHGVN